ncbi:MAG: hypothetical protein JXR94_10380, partial [Candidatus Hydrogenedentes bacterium]|nr:hypothetical protein [Candidatus Hydrogenedentota bacterium]
MDWLFRDPVILWDFVPLFAFVLLLAILPRVNRPGGIWLALLVISTTIWLVGEVLDIGVTDLDIKLFWTRVRYLGVVIVPVAWFFFVCHHCRKAQWVRPRNIILLSIIPAMTVVLVFTNEYHHLVWRRAWVDRLWGSPFINNEHAIW